MENRRMIRDALPTYEEQDCETVLYMAKWPDGYRCPRCAHPHCYNVMSRGRKLYECRSCSHQTSLTAGTILEGTRTPLSKWFQAVFLMQWGISAQFLAELISVTYKTAWLINHKLRHAIGEWDRDLPLEGDLQVLGEFYGYAYHRCYGTASDSIAQPVVVGASLDESGDIIHLKMKQDETRPQLQTIGTESVQDRFVRIYGNEALSLRSVEIVDHRRHRWGDSRLPHIWRDAVRWLAWTFGGIGPKHLQAYLNEFCFRLLSKKDMLAKLIELCGSKTTITYPILTGKMAGPSVIRWRRHSASRDSRQVS